MSKFSLVLILVLFSFFNVNAQALTIENELFPFIFKHPIGQHLIYPPIQTKEELNTRLAEISIRPDDYFYNTNSISILTAQTIDSIYRVDFSIKNRNYTSYSYFKQGNITQDSIAFFIIPGSGNNESIEIYNGNVSNYQGDILNKTKPLGDTYIFIKPNEDILAWHYNGQKLHWEGYANLIINQGNSYSSHYIVQAVASIIELKKRYNKVIVLGCSQGGLAALFASLKAKPYASVISSGYSILFDQIDWSGQNQIMFPGLFDKYKASIIRDSLLNINTKFIFTYGLFETDFYKVEARNELTKNFFAGNPRLTFSSDSNAHTYPQPRVQNYLFSVLTPEIKLNYSRDTLLATNSSLLLKVYKEAGLTYKWYRNDSLIANANQNSYLVTLPGRYKAKATRTNTLNSESNSILVSFAPFMNVKTESSEIKLKYYNDDANLFLDIINNLESVVDLTISIHSMNGNLIKQESQKLKSRTFQMKIPIYDLSEGVYIATINSERNSFHIKFIK